MLVAHLPRLLAPPGVVLASGSPRRAELLRGLGLEARILPSKFAENLNKADFARPEDYVRQTALLKTLDVYETLRRAAADGGGSDLPHLIIGADTIVERDGAILEKPADADAATAMLTSLSGRAHRVITAVVLVFPRAPPAETATSTAASATTAASAAAAVAVPRHVIFHEETAVEFALLPAETVAAYIATGAPFDKAGGYGIQDPICGSMVAGIHGCYYNVVGFPLHRFCKELSGLMALIQ